MFESMPDYLDGVYCCKCGTRLGWFDTSNSNKGMYYCDECAKEVADAYSYSPPVSLDDIWYDVTSEDAIREALESAELNFGDDFYSCVGVERGGQVWNQPKYNMPRETNNVVTTLLDFISLAKDGAMELKEIVPNGLEPSREWPASMEVVVAGYRYTLYGEEEL